MEKFVPFNEHKIGESEWRKRMAKANGKCGSEWFWASRGESECESEWALALPSLIEVHDPQLRLQLTNPFNPYLPTPSPHNFISQQKRGLSFGSQD